MLIAAKILLTLTTLGYALVTIKADFNRTHATNPKWTPHARFHVVWQILSYSGVGLIALYLIWIDGPRPLERLLLATALSAAIYGGFFLSVLSRPMFGGALYDDNGYLPFKPPIGPQSWRWDSMSPPLRFFRRSCWPRSLLCWRPDEGLRQSRAASRGFPSAPNARSPRRRNTAARRCN